MTRHLHRVHQTLACTVVRRTTELSGRFVGHPIVEDHVDGRTTCHLPVGFRFDVFQITIGTRRWSQHVEQFYEFCLWHVDKNVQISVWGEVRTSPHNSQLCTRPREVENPVFVEISPQRFVCFWTSGLSYDFLSEVLTLWSREVGRCDVRFPIESSVRQFVEFVLGCRVPVNVQWFID